ncbi:cysteine hydrolase family protein [Texcoconibacillus texcoconensis]|uniref:Nicotinamidase-related amidase n=1 Tax=Texcoconibacillus texcoconensis TaxID=1095777 RepID=A0A840QMR3_9BACI|nr:isochorismatase family cysteine hydrolase [Texcoconibacillus texcoconensis]MBB5172633.1 nicotinamidase-related amidase [Texcoconibacillus texcoconensis]
MELTKTACVLIDIQKESNFGIEGTEEAVKNTKHLIEECRQKGIPVIYTRHINRADGIGLSKDEPLKEDGTPVYYSSNTENIEVFDEIAPKDGEIVIDKYRWSAFYETSLDLLLRNMGVEHIIIGGFVTDGCLMTSVFDAYFRDYQVNLVHDISGASNEGAHMSAMLTMANWVYNLRIYSTEQLVNKLNNKDYKVWKSPRPDSLQFTPETMREKFDQIINFTQEGE